jgi:hypothetical protein
MRKPTAIATIFYLIVSALIPCSFGIMFPAGVATGWVYQLCFFPAFIYCASLFFALDNGLKMLSLDSSNIRKFFGFCIVLFILLMPFAWGMYTPVAMSFSIGCLLWSLFVVKLQYMLA